MVCPGQLSGSELIRQCSTVMRLFVLWSFFSLLAFPVPAISHLVQANCDPFLWREGHGDVGVDYIGGSWHWKVEEGRDVATTRIVVQDNARLSVPPNPNFAFLGEPGSPIWILPTSPPSGVQIPELGISSEGTVPGTFAAGAFELQLTRLEGPGNFFMWLTPFGLPPEILLRVVDGVLQEDTLSVAEGAHFHMNWAFTEPGIYRLGFTAQGVLTGQTEPIRSEEVIYTFEVGLFSRGHAEIAGLAEQGVLGLQLQEQGTGAPLNPEFTVLQVGPATWRTVPTDPAFGFLGAVGTPIFSLPAESVDGTLSLGFSGEKLSPGVLEGDRVDLLLTAVEGPGTVFYYTLDSTDAPVVLLNSADGLSEMDRVPLNAGTSDVGHWAFTQPGRYRVTLVPTGQWIGGSEVQGTPWTWVMDVQAPHFFAEGEAELEIDWKNGQLHLALQDEALGKVGCEQDGVLVVRPEAQTVVPEGEAFSFLGQPGDRVFVLPLQEAEGLLYLGLSAEELDSGVFVNDTVFLHLVDATGPGAFALYTVNASATPTVFMNTRDGLSEGDRYPIGIGQHAHMNWAFETPGEYRLRFEVRGTRVDGNTSVSSRSQEWRFWVQAGEGPEEPLELTVERVETGTEIELRWEGRLGRTYQIVSQTESLAGTWVEEGEAIPGVAGPQTVRLPISSDALKLFRLMERLP